MTLPTYAEALGHVRRLADNEDVELSNNARRDSKLLGYEFEDVCDALAALEVVDCCKIDKGHWDPRFPVATYKMTFMLETRGPTKVDDLFIEVRINPQSLYVLAFKLDGSPR